MTDLIIFHEHLPAAGVPSGRVPPATGEAPWGRLQLPFDLRQKARQRARLESGIVIGIQLPRGTLLRGGDRLRAREGHIVEVRAAPEPVSTVSSAVPRALARAAYHLGNRHVALEIGETTVHYLRDHVLDDMVRQLGFEVGHEVRPFEPEGGAYAAGHHHSAA